MLTLEEIYFKNRYEIDRASESYFSFSLENFSDSTFFDKRFAIITAYNPDNSPLTTQENMRRNALLYNELNNKLVLSARGCYEEHCEEGYLISDITLSKALCLGRKYGQVAIFYSDGKKLMYVDCKTEQVMVQRSR